MGSGGGVDWSEIGEDILLSVVNRLHTVTDYFHLTEVCKPWRTISTCSPHNNCQVPQPPFLMLAEPKKEHEEEKDKGDAATDKAIGHRGFVGLDNLNKVYELDLPELYDRRCVGSTGNWVIAVNKEQQVHIFNPFTRTQFQLPSHSALPDPYDIECEFNQEQLCGRFLKKVVLSSPIGYKNSNLDDVVAIACYGTKKRLAIARPGDESWTTIEVDIAADLFVHDVIFFKDRFYFVNCDGRVAYYDISSNPLVATHVSGEFITVRHVHKFYLVECMGELLLVRRYIPMSDEEPYYITVGFQVSKLNFDRGEWEDVKSLGQHSLFLGFNTSISLLASDSSTFQENCIYFTDDCMLGYIGSEIEGGRDMGVFDLEDGTIKPHYAGISTSWYSPPLWIIPNSLHQ